MNKLKITNAQIARFNGHPVADRNNIDIDSHGTLGRFSLIDRRPVNVRTEPGMVLHVHAGSISAARHGVPGSRTLRAGGRIVADADGVLVIRAHSRVQLEVRWPGKQQAAA